MDDLHYDEYQECDILIGSILWSEHLNEGLPLTKFFEKFWQRWREIYGLTPARSTRNNGYKTAHLVASRKHLYKTIEETANRRPLGGLYRGMPKSARRKQIERLTVKLSEKLANLPDLDAYVDRWLSVSDRNILRQINADPIVDSEPRLGWW